MKKDFDFIKNAFDNSGVNSPDSMGEEFVNDKLRDLKPVAEVPKKNKGGWIPAGISAAAAIAVITAAAIISSSMFGVKPINTNKVFSSSGASLLSFSSRDDVVRTISRVKTFNKVQGGDFGDYLEYGSYADDYYSNNSSFAKGSGDAVTGSAAPGSSYHNSTYIQETGVDEADRVKTDGRYIYYLSDRENRIDILSAEGNDSKRVAKLIFEGSYDGAFNDFYVYQDRLITLGTSYETNSENGESISMTVTCADIYDISDIRDIKRTASFKQSGCYCSSRMINEQLYIVTNYYAQTEQDLPFVSTPDEATYDEVDASCIYTVDNPTNTSFLVVSSMNTGNAESQTKTKAILGSAETVYCNQENLYVTAYQYSPLVYDGLLNNTIAYGSVGRSGENTQIIKISLKDEIKFIATTTVKGIVNNQYSLDEYQGNLRVATTYYGENSRLGINNLYVFDEKLSQIGAVTDFAPEESIMAVRYIGATAYVITYELTDPLFVIDVSDPHNPKISGEVEISGFSTMLVPVDDNTLLGIGYHTEDIEGDSFAMEVRQGLKLALFDVSDRNNPKILDEKVFKNYSSEVQYNPKALLVNFERGDYTVPYEYRDYYNKNGAASDHSGIVNFKVSGGKIQIIDDYTSEKFNSEEDSWMKRCIYIGNTVYMLGSKYDYGEFTTIIDAVDYK